MARSKSPAKTSGRSERAKKPVAKKKPAISKSARQKPTAKRPVAKKAVTKPALKKAPARPLPSKSRPTKASKKPARIPARVVPAARAATAKPPRIVPRTPLRARAAVRLLPDFLIGELGARGRGASLRGASSAGATLIAYKAAGAASLFLRAVYGRDRLGAVHDSELGAIDLAIGARPEAPDGHGFTALLAFEDLVGEIIACPLASDGLPLVARRITLSSDRTTASEPAVAAGTDRFWVGYQTGANIEVATLGADGVLLGPQLAIRGPRAGALATHLRPRLTAAFGGVALVFTVATVGEGGGAHFLFLDRDGQHGAGTIVSDAQGRTRLGRAEGGLALTVERDEASFDLFALAPADGHLIAWRHALRAGGLPGAPLAIGNDEVLALAPGDATRLLRFRLDGTARATLALAHPVADALLTPAGWSLLCTDGRSLHLAPLPR